MRILQVSTAYYPELQFGGPPFKIHALSQGLVARGHTVQVVTFYSDERKAHHQVKYDGVTVQYLPWRGKGVWQFPRQQTYLQEAVDRADVVHCYGYYNLLGPLAARIAVKFRRPYVLEPMGMYVPIVRSLIKKRIYHGLVGRQMVAHAANIIATSPQERTELTAAGIEARKVLLRRNGLDLAAFQRLPTRGAFRQRYGLDEREWVILYLGRLSPKKGLNVLLSAFAEAALPGARLVLVGPDDGTGHEQELRRQIVDLGLTQRVIFTGPLYDNHKLTALVDADVFVLPSQNENFGNAVAEAVAAGLPVIISRQCGIAPYIEHRVGLVIDGGIAALAEAIRRLSCDRALWQNFHASCQSVAHELSWDEPLQQMEQIYQQIMLEQANVSTTN
jgi:glycosyltransferase involved in cell wall biosynthesis